MSKIEFQFAAPFTMPICSLTSKQYPVGIFDVPFATAKAAFAAGAGAPTDPEMAAVLEGDEPIALEPATTPIVVEGLLSQTVKEIEEQLPQMELADLEALLAGEQGKDKPRKGVIAAIEAEIDKAKANPDAANEPAPADGADGADGGSAPAAEAGGPGEAPVE